MQGSSYDPNTLNLTICCRYRKACTTPQQHQEHAVQTKVTDCTGNHPVSCPVFRLTVWLRSTSDEQKVCVVWMSLYFGRRTNSRPLVELLSSQFSDMHSDPGCDWARALLPPI